MPHTDTKLETIEGTNFPAIELIGTFFDPINFDQALEFAKDTDPQKNINAIIVPHHLLASRYVADLINKASGREIDNIIIIGPNHTDAGGNALSTVKAEWKTPLGKVKSNSKLVDKCQLELNADSGIDIFADEHSIGAILPFVKFYLPNAKILPITISSFATTEHAKKIANWLNANLDEKSLVIFSLDFSHYLTKEKADEKDEQTKKLIQENKIDEIAQLGNDNVDSAIVLVTSLLLAEKKNWETGIIHHSNAKTYYSSDANCFCY